MKFIITWTKSNFLVLLSSYNTKSMLTQSGSCFHSSPTPQRLCTHCPRKLAKQWSLHGSHSFLSVGAPCFSLLLHNVDLSRRIWTLEIEDTCLFLPEREREWVNLLRLRIACVTSAREAGKCGSLMCLQGK